MGSTTTSIWTGTAQLPITIALAYKNIWGFYTCYLPTASSSSVTYTVFTYSPPASTVNGLVIPSTVTATVIATLHIPKGYSGTVDGEIVPIDQQTIFVTSAPKTRTSIQSSSSIVGSGGGTTIPSTAATSFAQSSASLTVSSVSSTQTTPVSTYSSAPKNQYSTSEFAGVAIGCFVGGLLIAGILSFLFLRKRLSHQRPNLSRMNTGTPTLHADGQAVYVASRAAWEKHLPQSESDNTIRNLASRTLDQIELHVENYYRDAMALPLNADVKSEIERLDAGHLATPTLQLIQQTQRPIVVIKHCIASLIISKITAGFGGAGDNGSFLPAEFMRASRPYDRREGEMKIPNRVTPLIDRLAYTEADSRWRVLTYLRPTPEHDATYQEVRDRAIVGAARQVGQAFGPWARGSDNARHQSLVNIMTRATEFGLTLFAQPASFEWQWSTASSEHHSRQIVALPGLYKTVDQDGRPLAAPLHLLEPRVGTLGSQRLQR